MKKGEFSSPGSHQDGSENLPYKQRVGGSDLK